MSHPFHPAGPIGSLWELGVGPWELTLTPVTADPRVAPRRRGHRVERRRPARERRVERACTGVPGKLPPPSRAARARGLLAAVAIEQRQDDVDERVPPRASGQRSQQRLGLGGRPRAAQRLEPPRRGLAVGREREAPLCESASARSMRPCWLARTTWSRSASEIHRGVGPARAGEAATEEPERAAAARPAAPPPAATRPPAPGRAALAPGRLLQSLRRARPSRRVRARTTGTGATGWPRARARGRRTAPPWLTRGRACRRVERIPRRVLLGNFRPREVGHVGGDRRRVLQERRQVDRQATARRRHQCVRRGTARGGERREQRHGGEDEPRAPAFHAVPAPVAGGHADLRAEHHRGADPRAGGRVASATSGPAPEPAQTNSTSAGQKSSSPRLGPTSSRQRPSSHGCVNRSSGYPPNSRPKRTSSKAAQSAERTRRADAWRGSSRCRVRARRSRRIDEREERERGGDDQAALGEHREPRGRAGGDLEPSARSRGESPRRAPEQRPVSAAACTGSENSSSAYEPSGEAIEASSTAATTCDVGAAEPPREGARRRRRDAHHQPRHDQEEGLRAARAERGPPRAGAAHAAGTCSRLVAMPNRDTASPARRARP
jgi:hypothetical protein